MAKIRKPGAERKLSAKRFETEIEDYFRSITFRRPLMIVEPEFDDDGYPVLDEYGHQRKRRVAAINADGEEVMETVWTEAPTLQALWLYMGIGKTTWYRYAQEDTGEEDETDRYHRAAARAELRIQCYLAQKLGEKDGFRGAAFRLEREHNLQPGRQEINITGDGLKRKTLTMDEKLQLIREANEEMAAYAEAAEAE